MSTVPPNFKLKENLKIADLFTFYDELMNQFNLQRTAGIMKVSSVLVRYIVTCSNLTEEEVTNLSVDEFNAVAEAVLNRYPLERILAPFLKFVQGQAI